MYVREHDELEKLLASLGPSSREASAVGDCHRSWQALQGSGALEAPGLSPVDPGSLTTWTLWWLVLSRPLLLVPLPISAGIGGDESSQVPGPSDPRWLRTILGLLLVHEVTWHSSISGGVGNPDTMNSQATQATRFSHDGRRRAESTWFSGDAQATGEATQTTHEVT